MPERSGNLTYVRTKIHNMYKHIAHFSQTSKNIASLLISPENGIIVIKPGIVCNPELLVDQRGLELSLLCEEIGISVAEVDVKGIENQYERDWVIYQAHHWRANLRKELANYERAKQEYQDSKARV